MSELGMAVADGIRIRNMIYTVRGEQVMLASELRS